MQTRIVVVGHGMVGSRFVEELVDRDPSGEFAVTVIGAEDYEPYNRVLLSDLVAGKLSVASLALSRPARSDRAPVCVHRGRAAVALDRASQVVLTSDGHRIDYDLLVLATGARARIPPIPGLLGGSGGPDRLPAGVHALRTLDDAREVVAATFNAHRAAVVGGGVLGLEVATGLARRGLATTVIHAAPALMERQLDVGASDIVAAQLADLGIQTVLDAATAEVLTQAGHVRGLRLTDGAVIELDLLVLSCGTFPETALAAASGLPVDRGVIIGADLASPVDPRVFALGDCAQPPEGGTGLIAQGWDQARRLAAHLAGESLQPGSGSAAADPAPPTTDVVRVKGEGLDIVAMGRNAAAGPQGGSCRTIRLSDPAAHRLVEVVIAEDRVVGATCVGAGQVAADLTVAYTRGTPLPADPAQLLIRAVHTSPTPTSSPTNMPAAMTVCRCNGVTKSDIVKCFSAGARTLDAVAGQTRATTGCGGCADVVTGLLGWLRTSDPDTAPDPVSQDVPARGEQDFPAAKHDANRPETRVS